MQYFGIAHPGLFYIVSCCAELLIMFKLQMNVDLIFCQVYRKMVTCCSAMKAHIQVLKIYVA